MKINLNVFENELARNCMTMINLSENTGINKATLTRIRKGKQEPQPKTIGLIAKSLKVSIEELTKGN